MSTPIHPPRRGRLSVAMIVRDEAVALPDALASVHDLADEIIVHDTGSRDSSREIARQFGARVIEGRWHDDFARARNECLAQVSGDWVLWLDASERLTGESAEQIRRFLATGDVVPRAMVVLVRVPGKSPDQLGEEIGRVRFHRHDRRLRFTGAICESLRPALRAAGIPVELSTWRIVRGVQEHQPETKRRKLLRNMPLLERELTRQGPQPNLLIAKGEILSSIGEQAKAAECFRQALVYATRGSDDMLAAYYGFLGTFGQQASPTTEQIKIAVEGLAIYPLDAQLLCAMGTYLKAQGRHELAERSYRLAHEYGVVNAEVWHVQEIGIVATICLSLTLQLQNRDDEALAVLDEALARTPDAQRLLQRSLELHVRHARVGDALAIVDRLALASGAREAMRSAVRGACHGAKQNWTFALSYLETAYGAGCRGVICLRWLTVSLLASGKLERGRELLAQWEAIAPGDAEIAQLKALVDPAASGAVAPSLGAPVLAPTAASRIPAPHIGSQGPIVPGARIER